MSGGQPSDGREETERFKEQAARRAVEFVCPGMVVGLGAGSTAAFAVRAIGERLREGHLHDVVAIPCSRAVAAHASAEGIPLTTLDARTIIDVTIDGADEVDEHLDLVKGAGGALLHEKMIAQASRREVIVIDESKRSPVLGTRARLPVEVVPFGWRAQAAWLESLGWRVTLRQAGGGDPYRTESGNLVLDCATGPLRDLEPLAARLDARAGVVAHGLFLGLASDLVSAGRTGVRHVTAPPRGPHGEA